jgi:hypothetical protein
VTDIRNQLARDLVAALNADESYNGGGWVQTGAASCTGIDGRFDMRVVADRLLSKYAFLELPEQSDGLGYCEAPVWIIGGKAPDVIAADTIIVCYPGPAGSSIDFPDEHAEAVAAAILAAHKTPLEER